MPRIPLIEDLTKGAIPPGQNILVEFDPATEWYNASLTIAAGWLATGGEVSYTTYSNPPDRIRSQLKRIGMNVEELENHNRLRIWDSYTVTLGLKSKEKLAFDSLKVHDLSLVVAKETLAGPPIPNVLRVADNVSVGTRFNDERAWFELGLTRALPATYARKSTFVIGVTTGVHTDWAYETEESAVDAILDLKLDGSVNPARNVFRIRKFRDVSFDGRWYPLKLDENFRVIVEK